MPAHRKAAHISLNRHITPPSHLSPAARAVWDHIVGNLDPTHFVESDAPLLEQYASSAALAAEAFGHLEAEGAVVGGKPNAWLTVHEKAVRASVALSARLRLSPQHRHDRLVAGSNARPQPSSRRPWEVDREVDDPGDGDSLLA
jgi:phage terminase small subunit